jgi:hypothetical protein
MNPLISGIGTILIAKMIVLLIVGLLIKSYNQQKQHMQYLAIAVLFMGTIGQTLAGVNNIWFSSQVGYYKPLLTGEASLTLTDDGNYQYLNQKKGELVIIQAPKSLDFQHQLYLFFTISFMLFPMLFGWATYKIKEWIDGNGIMQSQLRASRD